MSARCRDWTTISQVLGSAALAALAACRAPAPLDPDGVYLVERPHGAAACDGGLLVVPPGRPGEARCLKGTAALVGVGFDGWPVSEEQKAQDGGRAWRRRVPQAPGAGWGRSFSGPRDGELVAESPCGPRDTVGAFLGPGGELVVACRDRYVRRDGSRLELRGGSLVRLGEAGHALVRLPWGTFGVLGPDGTGHEVSGIPLGARLDGPPLASAAVADGFLLALDRRGGDGPWSSPELFHVAFDGRATSRGRFGPLGKAVGFHRVLGADGSLYTFGAKARPVQRWTVGAAPVTLVEASGPDAPDRNERARLLVGWRSAPVPDARFVRDAVAGREAVVTAYARVAPALRPCQDGVAALDPARPHLRVEGRVFDPADPSRFVWAPDQVELRLAGDGRLVFHFRRWSNADPVTGVYALPPSAASMNPTEDGERCTGPSRPGAAVPGGSCGVEMEGAWATVPGAAAVASQCRKKAGVRVAEGTFVGERELPDLSLRHAGFEGRLLLSRGPEWLLVLRDGRLVRPAGLPEKVHAIRAVPDGFVLVVDPERPLRLRNALDLVKLGDDGRVRRLGRYDGLPGRAAIGAVVITPDLALHALVFTEEPDRRTLLLRNALDGAVAEQEWDGGRRWLVELLTGP